MGNKIWVPLLIGAGVLGYFLYRKNRKDKMLAENPEMAIAEATKEEEMNFSSAFRAQYDIVMPPVQASKAVKKAARKMQDNRKVREKIKMAEKKPLYI